MRIDEYAVQDAVGLAELIRQPEVSADEVYAAALESLAHVNAIVDGPWERPLEYAADGPFGGVPFVLKDLGAHPAGIPVKSATPADLVTVLAGERDDVAAR